MTKPSASHEAIRVKVSRDPEIESTHIVHACVSSSTGLTGWGQSTRPTMPRSAIKSIQLLPLLVEGAADAFDVTPDEVALAASSHGAEPKHVELVAAWLERIGFTVDDLECGPAEPITHASMTALYAAGGVPTRLHNCCSGKHTGFLTLARHLGVDHRGYLEPSHPVQQLVTSAIERLCGIDLSAQTAAVDGCGIPVWQLPLDRLANGMRSLVTAGLAATALDQRWSAACVRVVETLPSRAFLVSGTGRAEERLTAAANEPVLLKGGAEGVFMGALPDRGIGFALKAEDGAGRAVDAALGALLMHLGAVDALPPVEVTNRADQTVGSVIVDPLS